MDIINLLIENVAGILTAGTLGSLLGWKIARRKGNAEASDAEWQVYKDQISHLMGIIHSQEDLIKEMVERHARETEEREQRFTSQTDRLREIQRNLVAANDRELALTREIGIMQLQLAHLKNWHCRKDFTQCREREPEQEIKSKYVPMNLAEELSKEERQLG